MKKCRYCDKEAIGVIPTYFCHWYVCEEHAKKEEAEGWWIDYENWRLGGSK